MINNSLCHVIVENVVRAKPTYQSGLVRQGTADKAVDGTTRTCSLADTNTDGYTPRGGPAWWQVDLETEHDVIEVTIKPFLYRHNRQIGKLIPQGKSPVGGIYIRATSKP